MAIATNVVSAISSSLAPAIDAFLVWASMHHGHWVIWAMPSAISSLVLAGVAPSLNAFWANSRNAREGSGARSRIFLNWVFTSTPWNCIDVPPGEVSVDAPRSAAPERRLALLAPRRVTLGLVLGQLEGGEAIEVDERGVGQVRDVLAAQQRL